MSIDKWGSQLQKLTHGEPFDVVIDGAGGDGVKVFTQILRLGGTIVSYGMTVKPKVDFTMAAVLRNIEIRGSTMVSLCFI
jgi:NADPH:quinone reductase-like Zn-dependent oxidoreductase